MLLNLFKNIFKKFILFAVSTSYCSICLSQQIEPGKYVSVYDYSPTTGKVLFFGEFSHTIEILDNTLFKYEMNYCGEIDFGFGTFQFESYPKKKLIFKFLNIPDSIRVFPWVLVDSDISKGDSIVYIVDLLHKDTLLPFSEAMYRSKIDSTFFRFFKTETGKLQISLSKSVVPGVLEFEYVGYGVVNYNVKDSSSRIIKVNFDSPEKLVSPGKVIEYRIKEISKRGFYLKGDFWKDWTYFMKLDNETKE